MRSSIDGISVIICCHNSGRKLPNTIKYVAGQKVVSIPWEVIVVDNNSSDDTRVIAAEEWQKYETNVLFQIVEERRPGLSFARTKGIATSKYPLLLFCDDDNWLQEDYVERAYHIMREKQNVGILGGRSTGVFETKKPEWFDRFKHAYAVGQQLKFSGIANSRSFVAGAGMVVRKSVFDRLDQLGFRWLLTGRNAKKLFSGEDCELCLAVMFLGFDLYYDENLYFRHFMTGDRLSWKYCVKMISNGQSVPHIYFEIYRYCFERMGNAETVSFNDIYRRLTKNVIRSIRTAFLSKPTGYPLLLLLKSQPGSRKEINFRASINKLKYLVFNKSDLRKDFAHIYTFVGQMHKYRTGQKILQS